jgi:hypothetical protein
MLLASHPYTARQYASHTENKSRSPRPPLWPAHTTPSMSSRRSSNSRSSMCASLTSAQGVLQTCSCRLAAYYQARKQHTVGNYSKRYHIKRQAYTALTSVQAELQTCSSRQAASCGCGHHASKQKPCIQPLHSSPQSTRFIIRMPHLCAGRAANLFMPPGCILRLPPALPPAAAGLRGACAAARGWGLAAWARTMAGCARCTLQQQQQELRGALSNAVK